MRKWIFSFLLIALLNFAQRVSASAFDHVTPNERRNMIRSAQIWSPYPVPTGDHAFDFEQTVYCSYVRKHRHGTSPKFHCRLDSGKAVKVKYGRYNDEVYAQVAASRLLWALGFGANANYPVRVVCRGCSKDPWRDPTSYNQTVIFHPATLEFKVEGVEISEEGKHDQGWGWGELNRIDVNQGGANTAQIDALKLLGVFMTHVDSRPGNQRFVCLGGGIVDNDGKKRCAKPFMYISDVGTTFGGAHERPGFTTLKLRYWEGWPVWKDPQRCIADLMPEEQTHGMLRSPKISEAGREFLASLLIQLTDRQIADIFRVARVEYVDQNPGHASVEEWVNAFKRRRDQIVYHRCPE